jgi:hypothetical protein
MSLNSIYFVVEELVVEIKGVGCLMEEGRFPSVAKLLVMLKVNALSFSRARVKSGAEPKWS